MSVISTATITNRIATDTHEITDATAWRCLVLSERTSWSLSSILRVDAPDDSVGAPVDEPGRQQAADHQ